jgi:hypothetical protein
MAVKKKTTDNKPDELEMANLELKKLEIAEKKANLELKKLEIAEKKDSIELEKLKLTQNQEELKLNKINMLRWLLEGITVDNEKSIGSEMRFKPTFSENEQDKLKLKIFKLLNTI